MKTMLLDWLNKIPKLQKRLWIALMGIGIIYGFNTNAQSTVTTLTDANHGKPGYRDGSTFYLAQFRYPAGICFDPSGSTLFVADCSNNAVRMVTYVGDNANSYTFSIFTNKDGISRPVDIAIDAGTNIYVLNRGTGKDGTILQFNGNYLETFGLKYLIGTNASKLTNATAIALDSAANLYAAIQSNTVIKVSGGSNKTVSIITNIGTSIRGMTVRTDGKIALTDAGNNGIWLVDPNSTNVYGNAVKFTGFHGAGDVLGPPSFAAFNRPEKIARAGNGYLVVADYNNHKIKVVDSTGNVSRLFGVSSTYWGTSYPGWHDGTVNPIESIDPVESRLPLAVTVATDGSVIDTENYYSLIREATATGLPALPPPAPIAPTIWSVVTNYGQVTITWSPVSGATSYNVKRSEQFEGTYQIISSTTGTSYTDTNVFGGKTYYYVVSASNSGGEGPNSLPVMAYVPFPPVPDPQIGYVDFPADTDPIYSSVFHSFSSLKFNNDTYIVILGATGTETFYTFGPTPSGTNTIPDPNAGSSQAPTGYKNGIYPTDVAKYAVIQAAPDQTIKAVGIGQSNQPNSTIISARIQFITANPVINGQNAAAFTISDITAGARLYYTIDGSTPSSTNGVDLGTVASPTNVWSVSFALQSNTLFKVIAYRNNYQPSAVVSNLFTPAAFQPNTISFGRSSGEPYSQFIARPGQFYYAPVTLNLVPNFGKMYSLQFNVVVTNGYTNILTGGPVPPVVVNSTNTDLFSMLMTSVSPDEGRYFPPSGGGWFLSLPPLRAFFNGGSTNFVGSKFVNSANNLLGVSWIFRVGFDYLYPDSDGNIVLDFKTGGQDLVTYSIVHDTLFQKSDGIAVVGAYTFQIPATATNGDRYFMQIGSPSATSDGVGAGIYIAPPTSSQAVTVGSPVYLAGDVAPFHWLNAGDFGEGMLNDSDVMQAYQTAIVQVDMPPTNSDFYLAVDSAGGFGNYDSLNNYYTFAGTDSYTNQIAAWDGNDLTINNYCFGDGVVDINDLFVTMRRSLDHSLVWYKRFWTNGQFVAVTTPNLATNTITPNVLKKSVATKLTTPDYKKSFITFTAGDVQGTSGQSIQVPIYAQITGDYPLRVLGLNLSVLPLDGSPSLTKPISFTPAAALGTPYYPPAIKGNSSLAAAWLNDKITGLTGTALVGTLTVNIPANASSTAAYAVHFNVASGSPNGYAIFPKQTINGLVTLSNRSGSAYNDGIPDNWRLRWFGTINNLLSSSNACPSGDGIPNWKKFVAGVNPNTANNFPSVNNKSDIPAGFNASIHWPSVAGKQYVVERSTTLFPANWSPVSTISGTGGDLEFNDNYPGIKFYRVRILP